MSENNPQVDAPMSSDVSTSVGWERATIEKLLLVQLREQTAARRWKVFFRLAWLALVAAAVWLYASGVPHSPGPSVSHTAMVQIRGAIDGASEASAENMVSSLRSAFEEPTAQAIVLLIDSPGGSPVQAGIVHDEIVRLKALHNKKVYVVVEEICASAAYYIAAAADEIYVNKASLVGSIGVLMDGFGFTGLMDKLGVERRLMTAGSNKALLDPFSPLKEQDKLYLQAMLDEIHGQFIDVVKKGRGDRLKITPDTFSGLVWSGQQAVNLGLADALGNADFVAREVVKAEEIIDYTYRENVGMRLARQFGASVGEGLYKAAAVSGVALR